MLATDLNIGPPSFGVLSIQGDARKIVFRILKLPGPFLDEMPNSSKMDCEVQQDVVGNRLISKYVQQYIR